MFVKVLSTRKTKIGTFRFGVVYEVDEKNQKVREHVLPLLKGDDPALEEISKKEAQKVKSAPDQFTPHVKAADPKATAADLRSDLAAAQKAEKEAEDKATKAEERAKDAEGKVEGLETQNAELVTKVTELEAELQTAASDLEAAKVQIADLNAAANDGATDKGEAKK